MVKVEVNQGVAVVSLDRPERRNAIGSEMVAGLNAAIGDIACDDAIKAVVIAGSPPGFCAGSDLKELSTLDLVGIRHHESETGAVCRRLTTLPKPVIAAVEGFALGGGLGLAISADVVVSSSEARWHMPEVPLGWLPPWSLGQLVRRVGLPRARMLTWGADAIDGTEAHRLGIVDQLTDESESLNRALDLAGKLAAMPREAVASTKSFFNGVAAAGDAAALDELAMMVFLDNCKTDAAKATFDRFLKKQKADS